MTRRKNAFFFLFSSLLDCSELLDTCDLLVFDLAIYLFTYCFWLFGFFLVLLRVFGDMRKSYFSFLLLAVQCDSLYIYQRKQKRSTMISNGSVELLFILTMKTVMTKQNKRKINE